MAAHLPIHVIAGEVKVCRHGFLRSIVETLEQHPKRNSARAVEMFEFRPTRRPSFPTGQRRPESRLGLEQHRVRHTHDRVRTGRGVNGGTDLVHGVDGQTSEARVLADGLGVLGDVDARDLVVGDVALLRI